MAATEAPERIGPYRLLRRLGEGGMGVVHLGLDGGDREVAVKVLHPHVASDLKARDRLTREVETMRRVRSPRVAEVLDADLVGATPYIVTRFAPGRTLEQQVLEDGPLGGRDLVRLARGLCEALVAIHAADVIHRDLKPANVMLVEDTPGAFQPLVIDFGIAHLVNATRLTQTGMFVGTPGYLAPEIIRDTEITQAADVHALAATVFFAATGQPPFGTGTFEVVCYNILEGKAKVELAPAWLRGWLRLALATDVGARPTAAALHRLARGLDPSVTVFKESPVTHVLTADDGTRVLEDGTRVLTDGTRVLVDGTQIYTDGTKQLNDGTRVLADGTKILSDGTRVDGTRVLDEAPRNSPGNAPGNARGGDTFSDLLPPVNYAKPTREPRQAKPRKTPPPPPPPQMAPPPYQPAYPPPFPDQRVAGYPAPANAQPSAPPRHQPPPPPQPGPYQPSPQPGERYRARHPVLALLLLTVLVAAACLVPVIVSLTAIALVLCLRVGNYLFGDLADRRQVRGASGADPVLAVLGTPWALIKAVFATLFQVPLAVMFGMCVWGGLVYGAGLTTDAAAGYAAGAFVAGLFVLPGGGGPRKAVALTLSNLVRSPGAGMVLGIVAGTIAFFLVMTAASADPTWAPWRPPSVAIDAIVSDLRQRGEDTVVNLLGGLVEDLMNRLGLGFLTFWN
ncbi:serine/threonine-protein kinase [Acrocarpospora catenulata]|uniref:serine/threonine-protein kinase n=1 Tax=Acrocarpospora catenulata TaxID=2836182 RepID=UPI001BDAAC67|nr:serine/threonine-protein kinase [Acrocarpospora catenulata]